MNELHCLRLEDPDEYGSISELGGSTEKHGLLKLTLGLAEVGIYVSCYNLSFTEYVVTYRNMRLKGSPQRLYRDVEEDVQVSETQRSLWTTWKINVTGLSEIAQVVLRAFALFNTQYVPVELVQELDSRFVSDPTLFRDVVHEELINQGSLLECNGVNCGVHPLVREFILFNTKHNKELFNNVWNQAKHAVLRRISVQFENASTCIDDLLGWTDYNIV